MSTPIKKLKEEGEVFFPLTSSGAVLTPNGQPLTNSLVELEDYSSTDGTESLPSSGGGVELYRHEICGIVQYICFTTTIINNDSTAFTSVTFKNLVLTYTLNNPLSVSGGYLDLNDNIRYSVFGMYKNNNTTYPIGFLFKTISNGAVGDAFSNISNLSDKVTKLSTNEVVT